MKPTIYEALREKLGREPTNAELNAELRRILSGEPDGTLRRPFESIADAFDKAGSGTVYVDKPRR
jgi:hypothetical protein